MLFLVNLAKIKVEVDFVEVISLQCLIVVFAAGRQLRLCFFRVHYNNFISPACKQLYRYYTWLLNYNQYRAVGQFKNNMREEKESNSQSGLNNDSRMRGSRVKGRKKGTFSKLSQYETNLQNFMANENSAIEKINPKGLIADAMYISFSGVIQSAELFLRENQDFQISYQIIVGQQWNDETPDVNDLEGVSTFCEAKNGIIHFSLNFDCLLSCVYVESWPQLIMTIKGFNPNGEIITKGYAQIHLPVQSGQKLKQTNIYSIYRQQKWYQKLFRFLQPNPLTLDQKDFQRIIAKGEGREVQKIRSIGKIYIRTQTLKRNFTKFGYK